MTVDCIFSKEMSTVKRNRENYLKKTALIVMMLTMIAAIVVMATIIGNAEDYFTVRVDYQYEDGSAVHDSYVAVFGAGEDVNLVVTNPVIPGYKPVTDTEDGEAALSTVLSFTDLRANQTVTVYYVPDLVHYKVRYFKQNIRDDLYTEDLGLSNDYYEKTGYTGEYPDELEEIHFAGFSNLFHEPDAIAADGSTVFKIYYDRDYELISFDLDGGYGVEPVYAKYGSTFTISLPKRSGYAFVGWAPIDDDGCYLDAEGNPIDMTDADAVAAAEEEATPFTAGTVGAGDTRYKAVWTPETTTYSVVYWIENADSTLTSTSFEGKTEAEIEALINENYTVIASKDFYDAASGTVLNADNTLQVPDFFSFSDLAAQFPDMSPATIEEFQGKARFFPREYHDTNPLADDTKVVSGDGSTRFNVYYDRKTFTMRFYYAKEGLTNGKPNGTISLTNSTKNFSKYDYLTAGRSSIGAVEKGTWQNGIAESLPTLNTKYTDPSSSRYIPGLTVLYTDSNKNRYYYYELTAKYNAPLDNVWLIDAVTGVHKKDYSDNEMCLPGSIAAEFGTNYKIAHDYNSNYTIKGVYEKLGDDLMFADANNDSSLLTYLISWTNTDPSSGWNYGINRVLHFRYENYVQLLPAEAAMAEAGNITALTAGANAPYTSVRQFTTIDTDGKTSVTRWYGLPEDFIMETTDSGDQYDRNKSESERNGKIRQNQTAVALTGFQIENYRLDSHKLPKLDETNTEIDWSEDTANDRHATIRFFYRRCRYSLKFRNLNHKDDTRTRTLYYGQSLSGSDINGDPIYYVPTYPNDDLVNYYTFAGWYGDPYHTEMHRLAMNAAGTNFAASVTMPADDDTLYARWIPVKEEVIFYNDFKQYSRKNALYSITVDYNTLIDTSDIPVDEDPPEGVTVTVPRISKSRSRFAGWYYINNRNKPVRFEPSNMPVTHSLKLYAEWESESTAKYKIRYVEKGTDTDVAKPSTGTLFVSKTRTFTAKSGKELNASHSWTADGANWWPTVSSHSVLIEENEFGQEYDPNIFTFEYIQKSEVWYRVQYLNADDLTVRIYEDKAASTNLAAVTEKARFKEGMITERLTRSIVLSASDNPDPEAAKAEELANNVITFYYSLSENETLYQVDHYVQSIGDPDSYDLYHSEVVTDLKTNSVDVDTMRSEELTSDETVIELITSGYTVADAKVNGEDYINPVSLDSEELIVIQLYYNRRSYPYTVKYVDYEQEKLYDAGLDPWNGELYSVTYSGGDSRPVGTTVDIIPDHEYTCIVESEEHKYTRISDRELNLTIRPEDSAVTPVTNVIKVYYRKDSQRLLNYRLVCLDETEEDFAALSIEREVVENADAIRGCTVMRDPLLEDYYIFHGWYGTPTPIGDPLSTDEAYVPELPGADMTYYAIFGIRKVRANVEIMFNNSGTYVQTRGVPQTDTDGSVTGKVVFFDDPHNYENNAEANYNPDGNFEWHLVDAADEDDSIYKYEFSGWYEIAESDGHIIEHNDITTTYIDNEKMDENYHYIAMFRKKEPVTTLDYEIRYRFETRANGTKDFVVKGTLSDDALTKAIVDDDAAYALNDAFIVSNAPFESNIGETFYWSDAEIKKSSSESKGALYAVVTAIQETKSVYVNYRLSSDGDYKTIKTAYGANRQTDSRLSVMDLRGVQEDGKYFSYWEIRKTADGPVVAKCYDAHFSFCMMDTYYISPVFESDDEESDAASGSVGVTLTRLDYSRNRWTDDEGVVNTNGSTDLLYTDFEIAFEHCGDDIFGDDSSYTVGVVYELCAKVPESAEFVDGKDYGYESDEKSLKEAILTGTSVKSYLYDGTNKRSIQISRIPNASLSNKNRVKYGKAYKNNYNTTTGTYLNANYLMKVTAYLIDSEKNVILSDPVYVCLREISRQDGAVKGMWTAEESE